MKKIVALLILVGSALTFAAGCSGANDVTGPTQPSAGDGTRHPRPGRNNCSQYPQNCEPAP